MNRKLKLALIVTALTVILLTSTIYALVIIRHSVPMTGSIRVTADLAVYSDTGCTQPITALTWGTLDKGASVSQTVYIKNIGELPVKLSASVESWTPSEAVSYLTLTANFNGLGTDNPLPAGSDVQTTLTLTVRSDAPLSLRDFGANLIITGTEVT